MLCFLFTFFMFAGCGSANLPAEIKTKKVEVFNDTLTIPETGDVSYPDNEQAERVAYVLFDDIEINNIYIPAGGDIPDPIENLSFAHKLCFMDDISEYFEQNKSELLQKKMILCGDFNVAPSENDVWSHKQLSKIVSHTPIEIGRITRLFNSLDFVDAVRKIYPEPYKLYSRWSYRNPNWQTNDKGRRLDHIWVTPNLQDRVVDVQLIKEMRLSNRPSDHVPVVVELKV